MGRYEVTQQQWQAIMNTNPSAYRHPNHPVENVSWLEVGEFISRLNQQDSGYRYRLPTEAEWEYACRAGTRTRFSHGNDYEGLDLHAWTRRNAGKRHHPVGTRLPNGWGLYDMHGNVWEWCRDFYAPDAYAKHTRLAPRGPVTGSERVYRGGSFHYAPQYSQSFYRLRFAESYRSIFLGFRLVLEPLE